MLTRLLTLPFRAPVHGGRWVIDQVLRAAEAEIGQRSVQEQIAATRAAFDRAEIDEPEFAARMDRLLDELSAAAVTAAVR
jgi:hypothetical protein